MIHIQNLGFAYHKKESLFNQLNLELATGSIYGLLGRNGAGKTTLLKLIAGMLNPTSGTIKVDGYVPFERKPISLEEIYFIPEEFEMPSITANQMMKNVAGFYPKFSSIDFAEYLSRFGVDANAPMGHLSFGQSKQVVISFGLATNTRFLLLDEPTNGLDIPSKSILRKILAAAVNENRGFIISTHQVRDLENMIDPVIILDQGRVIFNQTIDDILKKLAFHTLESADGSEVIYAEPRFTGYNAICKNSGSEFTELNIELLFNGIIQQPAEFSKLFNH